MPVRESLKGFANICYKILKSDRDCNLGGAGFTGEGKSCFLYQLFKEYSKISGMPFSPENITWSRKELLTWIDGKKGGKILKNGLREGQLPEYSPIDIDELFMLFYRRNWYDEGQIDAIGTLNMARDRHLLIGGNIPNFWDLDGAFTSRIRFYFYVPERGTAWIFEQEINPFSSDPWNATANKKAFRKSRTPYHLPNFLCQIDFPDWTPKEKELYYEVRNRKRVIALDQNKDPKRERYREIKEQRDNLIRFIFNYNRDIRKNPAKIMKLTHKTIADVLGLTREAVTVMLLK
jgi:hypothetical protein